MLADPKRILSHAGLQLYGKKATPPSGEVECAICDEDLSPTECFSLGCNHWFCQECWNEYLTNKVQSEGMTCVLTKCPEYKCLNTVPDSIFRKLCNPASAKRYDQYVLRSLVENLPRLKWCPAPRCERIIKGQETTEFVKCACGFNFCFKCSEELHAPATCKQVEKWMAKCKDQSETAHWIIANTHNCPKCRVRIEKNQGCNHMTCQSCKYEFCWVCFGPWSEHGAETGGFYKCNKYNPKEAKNTDEKQRAKGDLDRYLHYYQRYHNHGNSKKLGKKLMARTEARMAELQNSSQGSSWIDVQFLKTAMEQVFTLRQVLSFTYVFAYYLEESHEKTLFEYLQQQLEQSTEKLSELSEKPLEEINRTDVVNYTRVTNTFMQNLLDGVANGLTAGVPDAIDTCVPCPTDSKTA